MVQLKDMADHVTTPTPNKTQSRAAAFNKKTFHFTAGLLSGLSTSTLLQPADLLKTRVQQSSRSSKTNASPLTSALRAIYSSPDPIRSLWRGTLPSAIRTGVGSALYFGGLDKLRRLILLHTPYTTTSATGQKRLSNTANLLTGAFARAAAGFGVMPVTVVKVRYESTLYSYTSISSACKDIYRSHGLRGFFAGFGATAVRDAPYAGLYVLFYESAKGYLAPLSSTGGFGRNTNTSAAQNFVSGVLAAGAATAITNPFDAIKTRLQLEPTLYRNMAFAARKMLTEEGWRSMFDGLTLRMGRKGISSALSWVIYEELIKWAERGWVAEANV